MTANHQAGSQLMTLGVLKQFMRLSARHQSPGVYKLAALRNMSPSAVRMHLLYLWREGYIERHGDGWKDIEITGKGKNA